jgi:flagellar protein FlgJ
MTTPIRSAIALPASPMASANTYTDPNGLAALKKDPHSPQALRAVAQQVDALFMQMMLKSMRDASAAIGEPDSNEMSMYQDMFDKQIALTMSQHQGLGLGSLLTRQMGARGPKAAPAAPVTTAPPAPQPKAAPPTSMTQAARDFVAEVLPTIRAAAGALGVNPLALLAQAALETGWGQRMPRTADGSPSRNLFGIKADDHWRGARAVAGTVEYSGGVATLKHTAFRAYGSIEESVQDFARLLQNSPRYRQALNSGADADGYIQSIGRSGYATDPTYANKLTEVFNGGTLHAALNRTAKL